MPNGGMPLHRLFVDERIICGASLWLDGAAARYLGRALRLRPGSKLIVFDGAGSACAATVAEFRQQRVLLDIGEAIGRDPESPLAIRLLQCLSRGDRFDLVVQKSTELGVRRISPLLSEFSVVRLDPDRAQKKVAHWTRIAQSACEQCGRNTLPAIDLPVQFGHALDDTLSNDATRLLLQPQGVQPLSAVAAAAGEVDLLIGPEGGLSERESDLATGAGFEPVSMGPRILRTETAALAAVALVQSRFGDL